MSKHWRSAPGTGVHVTITPGVDPTVRNQIGDAILDSMFPDGGWDWDGGGTLFGEGQAAWSDYEARHPTDKPVGRSKWLDPSTEDLRVEVEVGRLRRPKYRHHALRKAVQDAIWLDRHHEPVGPAHLQLVAKGRGSKWWIGFPGKRGLIFKAGRRSKRARVWLTDPDMARPYRLDERPRCHGSAVLDLVEAYL